MAWPTVQNEFWTLARACEGRSIARFGDAELRLVAGPPAKQSKTQCHHVGIQAELARMLREPTKSIVCLPRLDRRLPNYKRHWQTFEQRKWCDLIVPREFGSAFITRPDSAPHIDMTGYWRSMRDLWRDKDIVLVIGEVDANGKQHSLTRAHVPEAEDVRVICAPERDAYQYIDAIEQDILTALRPQGTVILCLGATATCLAERLARRGITAYDLGHVGKFMPKEPT